MTAPALFELVQPAADRESLPLPENGPYLLPTKKGFMVHRLFHFGRVLVPIDEAPTIADQPPYLWPDINIPAELVGQAWSFFRAIWDARKSEAMVDITWSEEKGYRLFVPPQRASAGGVKADRKLEHYRGQMVGTIHSHCNFGAFHSGTDTHDADGHDGLHVTLGKVDRDQPEQAIMISVAGVRWDFTPDEVWGSTLPLIQHPHWWERFVKDPEPYNNGHVSTWRSGMGLPITPYTPHATDTKKPVTSIVAFTGTSHGSQKPTQTRDDTYTSIDELLFTEKGLSTADVESLDAMNDLIDDMSKIFDRLGFDFDYTLERQRNAKSTAITTHDDLTREEFDRWFSE